MDKTLILTLNNHNIFYVTDTVVSFYIAVPINKFDKTNITIDIRNDSYNLMINNFDINTIGERVLNIFKPLDDCNISLVLPVFDNNLVDNLAKVNDSNYFTQVDTLIGRIINYAYDTLKENNVEVLNDIILVNNGLFTNFDTYFVNKYGSRCQYKTLKELIATTGDDNLNKLELTDINFVIGTDESKQNNDEKSEEGANPDLDSTLILDEIELPNDEVVKDQNQGGYVSYCLLGVLSIVISLVLLYVLL